MDISQVADSDLDAAYAASYDARDYASSQYYGAEIVKRESSVYSFLTGVSYWPRFPKYEARTGVSFAGMAQSSVSTAASPTAVATAVGATISDIATGIGNTAAAAIKPLVGALPITSIVVGLAIVAFIVYDKK